MRRLHRPSEGEPALHAGRPGFSCHGREHRGENRIDGRAPASGTCRQFRRLTMVRRVADSGHRDCLALYFDSLRWDKTAHSRPVPTPLPGLSLTAGAFRATLGMSDGALQQRAAQQFAGNRQLADKLDARVKGSIANHS